MAHSCSHSSSLVPSSFNQYCSMYAKVVAAPCAVSNCIHIRHSASRCVESKKTYSRDVGVITGRVAILRVSAITAVCPIKISKEEDSSWRSQRTCRARDREWSSCRWGPFQDRCPRIGPAKANPVSHNESSSAYVQNNTHSGGLEAAQVGFPSEVVA